MSWSQVSSVILKERKGEEGRGKERRGEERRGGGREKWERGEEERGRGKGEENRGDGLTCTVLNTQISGNLITTTLERINLYIPYRSYFSREFEFRNSRSNSQKIILRKLLQCTCTIVGTVDSQKIDLWTWNSWKLIPLKNTPYTYIEGGKKEHTITNRYSIKIILLCWLRANHDLIELQVPKEKWNCNHQTNHANKINKH